ncbi:uncharacterized protein LOC132294475 [Cornus florida]|uniref:uncharacterized protein LOC132294475 n=1 Tax=Cornus florida TaxID=4283 RepID=UPI00289DCC74|nr:uncharacterized protein LOC132294475 [Cornus florida]
MVESKESTSSIALAQGAPVEDAQDHAKSPPNSPNSSTRKVVYCHILPMLYANNKFLYSIHAKKSSTPMPVPLSHVSAIPSAIVNQFGHCLSLPLGFPMSLPFSSILCRT